MAMACWVAMGLTIMSLQQQMEAVRNLAAQGKFGDAWRLSSEMTAEVDPERVRAELLLLAGDPAGALEQATQGLETCPGDLLLLHRAIAAALRISELVVARSRIFELRRRLSSNASTGGGDHAWGASLVEFEDYLARAEQLRSARLAAEGRSVWILRATIAGLIVFGVWVLRSEPNYGRPEL